MIIVLFGAPGSGKGTQAANITEKYKDVYHLSVGDAFRALVKTESELAKTVKSYIDRGALVPVEIVIEVVRDSLLKNKDRYNHFILDGFPRSVEQCEAFKEIASELKQDYVVLTIDVPDEVIIGRLTKRVSCAKCGYILNEDIKKCPKCGSEEFTKRKDDSREVISDRLNLYHNICKEVIGYFDQNKLFIIDGNCDINIIKEKLFELLETKVFKGK